MSELLNCLEEAQSVAAHLSSQFIPTGNGPIHVVAKAPYYCKSTDAFAGNVIIDCVRCLTHDEADLALKALENKYSHDDEIIFSITPPRPVPAPAITEDETVPF